MKYLASFDVVNDFIYIIFYIVLGYACILIGIFLMRIIFDISFRSDVIELGNRAALYPVVGGIFGLTIIYSGANIGDGPGWWCVIFAGSLGLITWFILGIISHKFTNIIEKITVERDKSAGIRFGFYLLSSGIILGRGVAGDWTNAISTVYEFKDSWPVLILTILMIMVEMASTGNKNKGYNNYYDRNKDKSVSGFGAFLCGLIYIAIAVCSIYLLPPLPQNPIYNI